MAWIDTSSARFAARHDLRDSDEAAAVLELLEGTHDRLAPVFPKMPVGTTVVLHSSVAQLAVAQPYLPLLRALTSPAGRRYLAGWFSGTELHVLAPRVLLPRASNVHGSREMLMLAPAALYAQLVVGHNNRRLPPPFRPTTFARYIRWAWLQAGAGQWFSGQTSFARPAIARRLREGREPAFPPGVRDAPLLGGTVFDLLASERGEGAAVAMSLALAKGGPKQALVEAFGGRDLVHTEGAWRTHLAKLASP